MQRTMFSNTLTAKVLLEFAIGKDSSTLERYFNLQDNATLARLLKELREILNQPFEFDKYTNNLFPFINTKLLACRLLKRYDEEKMTGQPQFEIFCADIPKNNWDEFSRVANQFSIEYAPLRNISLCVEAINVVQVKRSAETYFNNPGTSNPIRP